MTHPIRVLAAKTTAALWAIPIGEASKDDWREAHYKLCDEIINPAIAGMGIAEKIAFKACSNEEMFRLFLEQPRPIMPEGADILAQFRWVQPLVWRWAVIDECLPLGRCGMGLAFASSDLSWISDTAQNGGVTHEFLSFLLCRVGQLSEHDFNSERGWRKSPMEATRACARLVLDIAESILGAGHQTRATLREVDGFRLGGLAGNFARELSVAASLDSVEAATALAHNGQWDLALEALGAAPLAERSAFLAKELGELAHTAGIFASSVNHETQYVPRASLTEEQFQAKINSLQGRVQASKFYELLNPNEREGLNDPEHRKAKPGCFHPKSNRRALALLFDPALSHSMVEKQMLGNRACTAVWHLRMHDLIAETIGPSNPGPRTLDALRSLSANTESLQLSMLAPPSKPAGQSIARRRL